VAVRAHKIDGIVRRYGVQLLTCRKPLRLPESLYPAATRDPRAGAGFLHSLFDSRQKILNARCAFQIKSHFSLAHAQQVIVRVRHAGHDRLARQVYDASVSPLVSFNLSV
jgi:hypothetical protein